ncbi:MAG: hypothetical protein ACR2NW_09435 [Thermodesulfobacteriota bacterium]
MKRLFIIAITFGFICSAGFAEEQIQQPPDTETKDAVDEQADKSKSCRDVCVKRDGYGLCLEFEKRCNN